MHPNIPQFAVVGRVNEGKSSIIATLVENDLIEISPEPGTTQTSTRYPLEVGGRKFLEVIDTPGFQEPELALQWIKQWFSDRKLDASKRPLAVAAFVEHFRKTERFRDEVTLLDPIVKGAVVVYVVDVSHPFRANYEAEFEILQWTGQPRLALTNHIDQKDDRDYRDEWYRALSQYFNIIKSFNAHRANITDRTQIIKALQVLHPTIEKQLTNVAKALEEEAEQRLYKTANIIAQYVAQSLTYFEECDLDSQATHYHLTQKLWDDYKNHLRGLEQRARKDLETIYRHTRLTKPEDDLRAKLSEQDLFSQETWELLGLPTKQLVLVSGLVGATAGGAIDAAVGGHSFFMGTVLGGLAGAGTAGYAALRSFEKNLMGFKISGHKLRVGPIKNPNFPWIMIDRILIFVSSLQAHTHANRQPLNLDVHKQGIVPALGQAQQIRLSRLIRRMRKNPSSLKVRHELALEFKMIISERMAGTLSQSKL